MDSHYGTPATIFHVPVPATSSAFGENGPGTANVVEYVLSYFPSSRATPEFQKNIESDFASFDDFIRERAEGHVGLVTGWVEEEQGCGGLNDEKAKCYFVMRGWESMGHFEQLMKQDWVHEKALPILLGWKVESKMWHVENKARPI